MMELICLKTFYNRTEAEVVKGFLETNGIKAYISGNYCALMRPVLKSSAGLRLMVKKEDKQKASALLKTFE